MPTEWIQWRSEMEKKSTDREHSTVRTVRNVLYCGCHQNSTMHCTEAPLEELLVN